ncbi:carboxypeptidase regulatory-like domain-containing protein [Acidipila sp. EB88]|uniref:carboxypeptidase regulatory-like domain-containing protein n=1 Tax=Acidipila sp. EB88 TaxID=2305226 RepID=UPI000F602970|nr:carboxypeptidase regulatory-like domain-containing protein [Acidipila sp. EB88]RRA49067.1 carboxypeptidase regulatory-like domain-containing protein [Acidipila sp. EB88]
MKRILFQGLSGVAISALACVHTVQSQTVTGAITGTITDSSGAILPGAHITAHNVATGVDTVTTSNGSGFYRIEFLPIGRYTLTTEATGFGQRSVPAFDLEVLQTATFNLKLAVAGSSTTVDVSEAAPPILNTNDATLGTTFTANAIANVPLNGLDFSALTLYLPGAVNTAGTSGTTVIERSTSYTDTPNINGNRAQSNNYTLDGIDMNETFNNVISYSPAPEALQEIKVLTANSPADYGNVNGGGIVSVLKSGTNRFHGSAYGYVQDYRLNANSWANNNQGIAINPFSQSQFGGTFGGPILRDKLFFFVDYLGSRYHTGGTATASVLSAAMRNGDFSALCSAFDANGLCDKNQDPSGIQLYDAQNNFAPFVRNTGVPINNPVARYLFAHPDVYPLPNVAPTDGLLANNYQGSVRSFKANNQGDIKVEYDPNGKDKLTAFYSMSTAYDGSVAVLGITFPGTNLYPTKIMGGNWVHIFSPTLVNSARVGFTRTDWNVGLPTDSTGVFGTSGNSIVGVGFTGQAYNGFTAQVVSGGPTSIGNQALNNGTIIDNTYSYIDNLTWQRGLHYLSMGVQALRYQQNYPTSNNSGYLGNLNYTGAFTSDGAGSGGYGAADFVLDRVQSAEATLTSSNVGQRQWRAAGYINDDFRIRPNLTLNIGVRYEFDQPWIESNDRQGNIDVASGQVQYAGHVPAGAPAGSGLCPTRGCYKPNYRQIMPRLGFAYQPSSRFVVRGGYGATSFYEGNSSNQRLTSVTPFLSAVNVSVNSPKVGAATTARTAEQGFIGGTTSGSGTYDVYPQDIQPAYIQEWSLTTEYALTRSTSMQVGFIGEQGQHIEDYGNLNQYRVNGDPTSAPYYNNSYIGINGSAGALGVGSNSLLITESRAMMNYNALQAVLRQRATQGLEFTLNYTYGKAMTNSLGNYGLNVNGYSGAFQNYYDSSADYGPAGYDVKHNVSFTGVYALPIGTGKTYLMGAGHLLDAAVGGWKVGFAGVSYSGFPETVTTGQVNGAEVTGSSNNSNSFGAARVNQYRRLKIQNRNINHWFGTDASAIPCLTAGVDNGVCAFGAAANNVFGDSRNGSVRGPGYLNVDMSAFKDFRIYHEHSVGFRFDAFNALNIVSYGNPDTSITDTTFGQIASQEQIRSQERRLQFSANYRF